MKAKLIRSISKKTLIVGIGSMVTFSIHAQNIGINATGTPPNNSAGLDVDFTNKGVLIPRVALTSASDAVTIPSPATSLLVYNTGTGGLSPAGYYYNAGTPGSPNWVQLLTSGSALSGSGVATRVAFWTGATSLGSNANLYWDNINSRLGVGTATPAQRLDVSGNVQFSGALMPAGNAGTSGQILTSQGAGLPPTWQTPASIPLYGNNAQSVKLTTMVNTTSTSWVNIPGMSITMTPQHNKVFIFASVAARLTDNIGNAQFGQATMYIRVLVNGVEQAISKCILTDFDEDSWGGMYVVSGGSAAISGVPVNVTIGSPITVTLQWYIAPLWASSPWQLRCDPTIANIGDHAVLTVFD
ncbi:MAG TPA: hypothetical protein PK995_03620 [Bacteroidia bacterium]|nr:hypothetical protein [Bacteroidia bacterium]